jgi:hypothetical protein
VSLRSIIHITCVVLWAALVLPASAEDAATSAAPAVPVQLPPWMTPDVFKAAVQINMTDAQKPEFNKAVSDFISDHFAMMQKEAKRNAPNLDMRIKSKDKALVHALDDKVHGILTKEQWPAYENYKKELRSGLSSNAMPPTPMEPRSGPATR